MRRMKEEFSVIDRLRVHSLVLSILIHFLFFFLLYFWKVFYYKNRSVGKQTYLKALYFTLEESEIETKEMEPSGAEKLSSEEKRTSHQPSSRQKALRDSKPKRVPTSSPPPADQPRVSRKIMGEEIEEQLARLTAERERSGEGMLEIPREKARISTPSRSLRVIEEPREERKEFKEIEKASEVSKKLLLPEEQPVASPRLREPLPEEKVLAPEMVIEDDDYQVVDKEMKSPRRPVNKTVSIEEFLAEKETQKVFSQPQYSMEEFKKFNAEEDESLDLTKFRGIELSNYGWNWEPYLRKLRRHIKRHWFPPYCFSQYGLSFGNTFVKFRISRSGKMLSMEVLGKEGEGDPICLEQLHRSSIEAIQQSDPFPALPEDFPDPYLEIKVAFFYLKPQW